MRILAFLLPVLFIHFITGCDIANKEEKIPTYVHIDSFQFVSQPNTGTSSHKITNVMVYLDYAAVGMFDLPADVPILADKPGSLMLVPAVQYSGISSKIIPYPFYEVDTSTFTPQPGQRITVLPKTRYWGDSLLQFTMEDFESGNSFTTLEGAALKRTNDPRYVFEGTYGGVIEIEDTTVSSHIMSVGFQMPTTGANKAEVFLEMNYKCSTPFVVGLQTTDGSTDPYTFMYGFNPRDTWNKVYIGLEEFLTEYPNKTYRVIVRASKDNVGYDYVAFDNFKVVSRK